jgi:agmatinase
MTAPQGPIDASLVPRYAGVRRFARLPSVDEVSPPGVAVLGAPFDGATTYRPGARYGPAGIREASLGLRSYNPDLGVAPFAAVQVADAGDAAGNPVDIEAAHAAIHSAAAGLHAASWAVVGLGGDHSVSLPLLRAAAQHHGPLGLVQLDAHTDTWDSYFGSRLTHGTMFRRAVEEGVLDPHRAVQIGLRGSLYGEDDENENEALGFRTFPAREFAVDGVKRALDLVSAAASGDVYLTVDIDVLDPAFAPGTGTPEIGGLTTRELLELLRGIAAILGPRLVAGDVVEVSPPYDPTGATALAGANAAYHIVSMLAIARAPVSRSAD